MPTSTSGTTGVCTQFTVTGLSKSTSGGASASTPPTAAAVAAPTVSAATAAHRLDRRSGRYGTLFRRVLREDHRQPQQHQAQCVDNVETGLPAWVATVASPSSPAFPIAAATARTAAMSASTLRPTGGPPTRPPARSGGAGQSPTAAHAQAVATHSDETRPVARYHRRG